VNPDPERVNDGWAAALAAARLLPGRHVRIEPHDVPDGDWVRRSGTRVPDAQVEKVVLTGKGWPWGVAALDWRDGDVVGRTMYGWPGLVALCEGRRP
jgi:hypothetical protein